MGIPITDPYWTQDIVTTGAPALVEMITEGWVRVTLTAPPETRGGRCERPIIAQLVMPIEALPAEWAALLEARSNIVRFPRTG